jgi:citrate lyase subunit beta / citryl-CoA lyase
VNPSNAFVHYHTIRSKLFVPGSRAELFAKAVATSADALSFDLEDAVAESKKEEARAAVSSFLRERNCGGKIVIVRVNSLSSDLFLQDVEALVGTGLDIINLPKVESREDVQIAAQAIAKAENLLGIEGHVSLLANIETPKGLRLAAEIASSDRRVMGLQVGFSDFLLRCRIDSRNQTVLDALRLGVRFAAAEAGIAAFDGAFVDARQSDAFRAEAEDARRLGFTGKSCIHPAQVPIANEVFSPRTEEIDYAARVLAEADKAAERGAGAFLVDGRMIDNPSIAQARAVVALASHLGIIHPKQGV